MEPWDVAKGSQPKVTCPESLVSFLDNDKDNNEIIPGLCTGIDLKTE